MIYKKYLGILMSEENVIFGHLDTFCVRIKCVCDQIVSLVQFQALYRASLSLSRPKREDINSVRINRKDLGSANSSQNDDEDTLENGVEENQKNIDGEQLNSIRNNKKNQEEEMKAGIIQSLGILVEENESEIFSRLSISMGNKKQVGSSSIQNVETSKEKTTSNNFGEMDQDFSSDSDFEDIEELDKKNEANEEFDIGERNVVTTGSVEFNAESLFKLEKSIENDSKKIMKKAHLLSKEDLKLMSKSFL